MLFSRTAGVCPAATDCRSCGSKHKCDSFLRNVVSEKSRSTFFSLHSWFKITNPQGNEFTFMQYAFRCAGIVCGGGGVEESAT